MSTINNNSGFFNILPRDLTHCLLSCLDIKDVKQLAQTCKGFFSKAVSFLNAEAKRESHLLLTQLKPLINQDVFKKIEEAREPLENPTSKTVLQAEESLLEFNSKAAKEFSQMDFHSSYKQVEKILSAAHPRLKTIGLLATIYRELNIFESKPSDVFYSIKIQMLLTVREFKTCFETLKKIKITHLKQEAATQILGTLYAKGKLALILEFDNGNLIDEFSNIYGIERSTFLFNLFINFFALNDKPNLQKCMNLLGDEKKQECEKYLMGSNALDFHLNCLKKIPEYNITIDDFIHSFTLHNDETLGALLNAKRQNIKPSFISPIDVSKGHPIKRRKLF